MRSVLLLAVVLLGAATARAGDEQVAAWERALSGYGATEAEREAARVGLVALPDARVLPVVRRMLGAAAPRTRIEGARLVRLLGVRASSLLSGVLDGLCDPDERVRAAASEAAGDLGADPGARARVVKRLLGRLDDLTPAVLAAALDALVRLGACEEDAFQARLLDREFGARRLSALIEDSTDRLPSVRRLLRASSRILRRAMLREMQSHVRRHGAAVPPPTWTELARERLQQDPSGDVRGEAVDLLWRLAQAGADVGDALGPALRDVDPEVRAGAYGVVDRQGLASSPQIRGALVEDLGSQDPAVRGCAAWLLRSAPEGGGFPSDRIGALAEGDDEHVARAAAATLLTRGAWSAALQAHLLAFVAESGVDQPYPEPARIGRDLGGGRQLLPGSRWQFHPWTPWTTQRVKAAGARVAAALADRLDHAEGEARLTWIHALGHAGPEGIRLLQARRAALSDFERFVLDLMRVYAGDPGMDLVESMLATFRACYDSPWKGAEPIDWPARRGALASEALVELGARAAPAVVAFMRQGMTDEQGVVLDAYTEARRILRAIGKPALPAVREAAQDPDTGHLFEELLKQLER